ncbi:acyl carrier protein [Pseudomonas sp. RIT-To-2]|uniref:acyl carrier protein n=1 Tax=Pseudomonas sp. RIT-To-2 TaxID=3462541 RepID=UPI00241392A2
MTMMTTSDIYDQLKPVFADVFDEDDLVLTPATTADNIDGWDSLAHIRLMVSVQKAFDIKLSANEIGTLKNVGDLVTIITHKKYPDRDATHA